MYSIQLYFDALLTVGNLSCHLILGDHQVIRNGARFIIISHHVAALLDVELIVPTQLEMLALEATNER